MTSCADSGDGNNEAGRYGFTSSPW